MDENKVARQRLILIIAGFITFVVIISLIAITFSKGESIPTEKTNISAANRESETQLAVYNMNDFTQVSITSKQTTLIEASLKKFVSTYTGEDLKYVSVDGDSITIRYNNQTSSNEIQFIVTSNNNNTYTVSGLHVTTNDMYVSIKDSAGKDVYEDDFDADHDH